MKALILKEPGEKPDIRVVDSPEPSLTSDGVIIKVGASGICHHDISVMDGTLFVTLVKMEEIICVAMAMATAMVLMGGSLNILGWVNKT